MTLMGSSFLRVLDDLVHVMIFDLLHAGTQVLTVTVLMHRGSFMMCMEDGAGMEPAVVLAGDVPAVLGILRLKSDAVASGKLDREIAAVDFLNIFPCEHLAFLLSGCSRRAYLAVVY